MQLIDSDKGDLPGLIFGDKPSFDPDPAICDPLPAVVADLLDPDSVALLVPVELYFAGPFLGRESADLAGRADGRVELVGRGKQVFGVVLAEGVVGGALLGGRAHLVD